MERLSTLFGERRAPERKRRRTERGDVFDQLLLMLNPARKRDGFHPLTHPRLGYLLTRVPTKDLYALVSKMRDAERRGGQASAIFWSEIRPRKTKHERC